MKCFSLLVLSLASVFVCSNGLEATNSFSNGALTIYAEIDSDNSEIMVEITGPTTGWFGIGFGASSMDGTYVIYADATEGESCLERELGNGEAGNLLTSTTTLVSDNSTSTRTIICIRALAGSTDSYYSFDAIEKGDSIDVIWAHGGGDNLPSGHQDSAGGKGASTLRFTEITNPPTAEPTSPTMEPVAVPTMMPSVAVSTIMPSSVPTIMTSSIPTIMPLEDNSGYRSSLFGMFIIMLSMIIAVIAQI